MWMPSSDRHEAALRKLEEYDRDSMVRIPLLFGTRGNGVYVETRTSCRSSTFAVPLAKMLTLEASG